MNSNQLHKKGILISFQGIWIHIFRVPRTPDLELKVKTTLLHKIKSKKTYRTVFYIGLVPFGR
jgi:hypothetical protein